MEVLLKPIVYLPKNLHYLYLNIISNNLGTDTNEIKLLA